jgi:ATP phosphoribosyltransferase
MLKIALPVGKSLQERTFNLFAEARIQAIHSGARSLVTFDGYPDLKSGCLVKPRRIPCLVKDGDFDVGITGSDAVLESGIDIPYMEELSYSKVTDACTEGVLFVHESDPINSIEEIPDGSIILSEYPNITRKFFAGKRAVTVIESPGSAEAEIPLRYRFGVVLSETGRSLRENQLKRIGTLFRSTTVLIANVQACQNEFMSNAIHKLKLLLIGALEARCKVLVSMNVPEANLERVVGVLPALGSPTISHLYTGHYFSVSSVVSKKEVNELIDKLLKEGAKGIIVMPISSVIEKW